MAENIWAEVDTERLDLARLLDGLSPMQWDQPSLCTRWRVREVVAHLLFITEWTPRRLITGMIRAGGNANRFIAGDALTQAATPSSELLQRVHLSVGARRHPPGTTPAMVLCDHLCHAQDIRRALPKPRAIPTVRLRMVADALVASGRGIGSRPRARGLHLLSADLDWTHGHGPQVSGPTEALIMALAGRRDAIRELRGPGVATLASRIAEQAVAPQASTLI
ncbi:MAG: maleylpyruvate isomerase family mycothiol-dependent enzyme [Pseudonocardia sp.]|nr:maleylpyruvate isomerase family mycothiol-dependent enzyme [Pseudonocardia sp.]